MTASGGCLRIERSAGVVRPNALTRKPAALRYVEYNSTSSTKGLTRTTYGRSKTRCRTTPPVIEPRSRRLDDGRIDRAQVSSLPTTNEREVRHARIYDPSPWSAIQSTGGFKTLC